MRISAFGELRRAFIAFFVVKIYVPHLLFVAEIQQVGPGGGVVRGD
jgi:hypothetical protein